jgi:hypothetical protein
MAPRFGGGLCLASIVRAPIVATMKACTKCGVEKNLDEFYFRKERGIHDSICRACTNDSKQARRRKQGAKERVVVPSDATEKYCTMCEEVHPIEQFYTTGKKVDGTPRYKSECKKWTLLRAKNDYNYAAKKAQRSATVESYLRHLLSHTTKRSRKELTIEGMLDIWSSQSGLCAYSGIPMEHQIGHPHVASIDRIDSSRGYTMDNVQLVIRPVNFMKSNMSEGEFLEICKLIAERN